MSDCRLVWCQEYIDKYEAEERFKDHANEIRMMGGAHMGDTNFYFLPEAQSMARNDFLVLSYVWYKSKRRKQRLYSRSRNQFFDFAGGDDTVDILLQNITDLEVVNVEVPTWKVAVVLNDKMMYNGVNPLGFDQIPFVEYIWNQDNQISLPPRS